MGDLTRLIASFTLRQKLTIAAAALLIFAGLWYAVRWNKERDLRPLFTNVGAEDSGALVERLRSSNVEYRVSDDGTILVPSQRVAELRLDMAAAGLPRTGRIGFELFDKTNFGTTEFAEQVNYRRALEGELERSVLAIAEVQSARVHVTFAKDSVYLDHREPAKASVMVKLKPGASLSPQNIQGITHLTASAVEGLAPQAVSVLDMSGALLNRPRQNNDTLGPGASDATIEYRQTLEREMQAKIRTTLDPLLGEDRYRSGVSIECDFSSGEQSEETFDPNRTVMVNSQKTEDLSGTAVTGGVPGTASTLPRGVTKDATGGAGVSRRTESVNYQASRTVKRTTLPSGNIKRLSVSVLVDQDVRWEGAGKDAKRVVVPPPPEKLKVVRDVLAGSIGYREDRGDLILVESLPFDASHPAPPAAEPERKPQPQGIQLPGWLTGILGKAPLHVWLGAGLCLLISAGVGLFWFFRQRKRVEPEAVIEPQRPALPPDEHQKEFEHKALAAIAENQAELERQENEILSTLRLPPTTKKSEVLKKHLADQAIKDPAAVAHLVRTWLGDKGR